MKEDEEEGEDGQEDEVIPKLNGQKRYKYINRSLIGF